LTVIGEQLYSVGTTTITSGAYSLTTDSKRVAAYVYGHFDVDNMRGMSYGYPAGFDGKLSRHNSYIGLSKSSV
jgi:hypothetical protein